MRITEIRECAVPISRYADPSVPSGGLTTSMVAVVTDAKRGGKPITGYGFASIGRYAQSGLIRERFAPRLLKAADDDLIDDSGRNLDPFRAWAAMMTGEKPGGHGERCVAVGTLDMAIWDAAAKIAGLPLYQFLADRLGNRAAIRSQICLCRGWLPLPEGRYRTPFRRTPPICRSRLHACQDQDRRHRPRAGPEASRGRGQAVGGKRQSRRRRNEFI